MTKDPWDPESAGVRGRETPGLQGPWLNLQHLRAHGTYWFEEANASGATTVAQEWAEGSPPVFWPEQTRGW